MSLHLEAGAETWGGQTVGIVAVAVFVVFAVWIVVQRMRHGRGGGDNDD